MVACYLRILYISVLIMYTGQTLFDCPQPVTFGDIASFTCSNLTSLVSINNPARKLVASCTKGICGSEGGLEEKINITFIDNTTILLIVHEINNEDEGEWTCQSGKLIANCSLNIYKLPSCEISSTSSTNNLSLGQDLPLNINLTDYYCTNNIAWNLKIGDQSQNVTEFRDREETDDIRSRIVKYSTTVTSSLTGPVELTFNCNDKTYDVSCSGVKELQLRGAQSSNPSITVIIVLTAVIVVIVGVILTVIVICRFKRKKKSINNDPAYSDVIDTLPEPKNVLKVTGNDSYTEISDVSAIPKRPHLEANDVNGDSKGGISETVDAKGSQKKLSDIAGREGDLNDKSRPKSVCQMVPNPAYESVDDIRSDQNRTK